MFGKKLLAARKRAKLSQKGLAAKSGVKASVISDLERGKCRMTSYDRLVKLAAALGTDPAKLSGVSTKTAA